MGVLGLEGAQLVDLRGESGADIHEHRRGNLHSGVHRGVDEGRGGEIGVKSDPVGQGVGCADGCGCVELFIDDKDLVLVDARLDEAIDRDGTGTVVLLVAVDVLAAKGRLEQALAQGVAHQDGAESLFRHQVDIGVAENVRTGADDHLVVHLGARLGALAGETEHRAVEQVGVGLEVEPVHGEGAGSPGEQVDIAQRGDGGARAHFHAFLPGVDGTGIAARRAGEAIHLHRQAPLLANIGVGAQVDIAVALEQGVLTHDHLVRTAGALVRFAGGDCQDAAAVEADVVVALDIVEAVDGEVVVGVAEAAGLDDLGGWHHRDDGVEGDVRLAGAGGRVEHAAGAARDIEAVDNVLARAVDSLHGDRPRGDIGAEVDVAIHIDGVLRVGAAAPGNGGVDARDLAVEPRGLVQRDEKLVGVDELGGARGAEVDLGDATGGGVGVGGGAADDATGARLGHRQVLILAPGLDIHHPGNDAEPGADGGADGHVGVGGGLVGAHREQATLLADDLGALDKVGGGVHAEPAAR